LIQSNEYANEKQQLTSAPIKANVLMPLNKPKNTETISIPPATVKIDESNAISRKCDHPGVVGEKDS